MTTVHARHIQLTKMHVRKKHEVKKVLNGKLDKGSATIN
jgi:hypothetical protein